MGLWMLEETHWEKAAKTRMGKYLTSIETDFISSFVDLSKVRLIVDVGAEAGRFSLLAASGKVEVVSLDIDAYSLHRLKNKHKDAMVIQADARYLPLQSGLFDAVFMIEVIDYILESLNAITECSRILKPASPFILSFGNQSSLKAKLRGLRGKSYMHSYREIINDVKKAGLTIVGKKGYSWLPFGRTSENGLVSLLASAEKVLGLRRIPSWSPWVLISAKSSPANYTVQNAEILERHI
jgi:ubiquinone/menaquinone biosynthesis C-methylase UbiE